MTRSVQEALVSAGLVKEEQIIRRRKEQVIDDMLDQFDKLVISNATFSLKLQLMSWSIRPENRGKSKQDFIAHARSELLARI